MANYRAVASGNWSAGATWAGGAVPPNNQAHDVYSNNFTVTIDTNVNVNLLTNASNAGTFVGGGTAAAGGGFTVSATGLSIVGNISSYTGFNSSVLTFSGASGTSLTLSGNVTGNAFTTPGNRGAVNLTGAGTLTITGNITSGAAGGNGGYGSIGVSASNGILIVNGNISTSPANSSASVANGNMYCGVCVTGTSNLTVNSATISGADSSGFNSSTGITQVGATSVILNNCNVNSGTASPAVISNAGSIFSNNGVLSAANGVSAISASLVTAYGTFVYSPNGTNPLGGARVILGTTPTNAYTQFALNGINSNSFVRYYTADNNLGQANPTDVRSGVSYASGNLTGRLTVPARGSVALSVNYGPSMPFTATRSGTTATATLAYSYPLVVGDTITATGASNTEWNSSYTIDSVVSGTSVTFVVPATHSATAGTGALMQTTGTAVLDPAAVASAVWGAASRTITGGVVDTLTNAPSVPSAATIASQVRTELGTELGRIDAAVSSRLAPSGTLATVTTLTNAPSVPSAAAIASQVRTELATELARVDAAISTRATQANIDAIKAKTDLLNTDRLAQVSTVSTTGAQLAAALS